MAKPPTFNDLKRRRSSSEENTLRRFKIIPAGVFKFTLPPFPNPFTIINVLGTELFDPLGTENLNEIGIDIHSNKVLTDPGSPYLREFYTNRNISVTPVNYPFDSLWFLNNNFKSKSNEFTFFIENNQTGVQNIERRFYSSFTPNEQLTENYSFTGYDFKQFMVNLSADKSSISFEAGDFDGETISLINNLSTGKFLDNNVQFKIDYGKDEGQSSVYNNFDTINSNNYTSNLAFTGTKTFTLSTIRNDSVQDLNLTQLVIDFEVITNFFSVNVQNSIHSTWEVISAVPNPEGQKNKFRFLNDNPTDTSGEWNTEWWGYSARDLFNFSGVTYKAIGFPSENNISLFTPKHGVCQEHWGSDPRAGDTAYFYDHTNGNAVSAIVEGAVRAIDVPGYPGSDYDMRFVRFDRDITSQGDIKVYKLPLYNKRVLEDSFCVIHQGGNGPFGTGSSDRYAGLGTHTNIINVEGPVTPAFNVEFQSTDLWLVSAVFTGSYFGLSSLAVGDSSSPSFIITDDDILLASGFTGGGGSGPNYGLSTIQGLFTSAIDTLGNSEGYTLSTVNIS